VPASNAQTPTGSSPTGAAANGAPAGGADEFDAPRPQPASALSTDALSPDALSPDALSPDPLKTVAGTWFRPSEGAMSSCFCMRWGSFHEGIDLAGPMGSPIVSAGDGIVLDAGPAEGFGNWIVIQQANGDVTIYGHMFVVLVQPGEHVTAGEHIANIGDDGEATGPHLHFGVRQGGITGPYIDPVPWLRARGIVIGAWDPAA
jgi:murein DD-endopeptidase MepM/ murein hydrolase activator NlpD